MSTTLVKFKLRRDTDANLNNVILSQGEPAYSTDTHVLKIGDGITLWNTLPAINSGGNLPFSVVTGSYPFMNQISSPLQRVVQSEPIGPGTNTSTFYPITDLTPTITLTVPSMSAGQTWRVDCQCSCRFTADASTTTNNVFLQLTCGGLTDGITIWREFGPNITPTPSSNINSIIKPGFCVINIPPGTLPDDIPSGIQVSYAGLQSDPGTVTFFIESLLFTRIG